MPVELWFPTPTYFNKANGEELEQIQSDFERVFVDLKNKGIFTKREDWGTDKHSLTDPNFEKSIINDYNLLAFQKFIFKHVCLFLSDKSVKSFEILPRFKIAQCWMTLTKKGESAHIHDHGSADLSGVYYFKTIKDDGKIFFESPNKIIRTSFVFQKLRQRVNYEPEVGKIILFPGGLEHGVHQNTTNDERVSVSFNIYFER